MAKRNIAKEIEEGLNAIVADLDGNGPQLKARFIPTPKVGEIRKGLGLSQAKFSNRFGLNPRTVQDWEQGRRQPDQLAAVLLNVIKDNPAAVARTMAKLTIGNPPAQVKPRAVSRKAVAFAAKRPSGGMAMRSAAKKR